MKIAVDASCLNRDHVRGMGKYLWNVLTYAESPEVLWRLFGDRYDFPTHIPDQPNISMEVFEIPGFRFHSWEQYGLPSRAKREKANLLFCTSTGLPWWQPIPTVVTIHDTVPFEAKEEGADDRWYWDHLLPRSYRKAAAIITISESSRRDILKLWPDLDEKLTVIPHGIDPAYLEVKPEQLRLSLREHGIRSPYLLYLGGPISRKRVDWAIQVFEKLERPDLQLVLCGFSGEAKRELLDRIPLQLRDRVCVPSFIEEGDMPQLFQNAVCLLYPTLYEGFGFPAVESQAVGTPAIFSRVGSLAELEGPGSIMIESDAFQDWVNACQKLVNERHENPRPLAASREWAKRFCWRQCAKKHLNIFAKLYCNVRNIRAEKPI